VAEEILALNREGSRRGGYRVSQRPTAFTVAGGQPPNTTKVQVKLDEPRVASPGKVAVTVQVPLASSPKVSAK
jgi:hypothetical protein